MCMDNLLFNDGADTESVRVICHSPVMKEMICRVLSPHYTLTDRDASFTVVCTESEPPRFRGPGIVITADKSLAARGFEASADGGERIYLSRPLDIAQLIKAAKKISEKTVRRIPGGYCADSTRCTITLNGREAVLTKTEFLLFSILAEKPGEPVSREEIESRLWNGEVGGTACGVYISYLRKKLSPIAGDGAVVSVRAKGYMLCLPQPPETADNNFSCNE